DKIDSAVARVIERDRTNVLHFFLILIVSIDETFVIRVDDVPITGIGYHKAAFATAGHKPVFASDHTRIAAAGDADVGIVLLRAVNVIGKCAIDGYMIKRRGRLVVLRRPVLAPVRGG